MRRLIGAILMAGAVALALVTGGGSARAAQHTAEVNVISNAFQPAAVTINVGGTVTWRVTGGLHTVTSTDPAGLFDSGDMNAGKTFQFKFDRPGTYTYVCENHPNAMKATVIVQGAAAQATATPQRTATPAVPGGSATTQPPALGAVAIVNFAFQPGAITVPVGTTVTWTNTGAAPHTVTSDTDGVFDSGRLTTGQRFQFRFDRAGTFAYQCAIHPAMKATITVQGQGAGQATATATASPQRTATATATRTATATATQTATVSATAAPAGTAPASPTVIPVANVGATTPKKPAGGLQLVLISVVAAMLVMGGLSAAAWRFAGRDQR